TEWRLKFRKQMNKMDNEASTQALDSLLKSETVKYCGTEAPEALRFNRALESYENAAVKSKVTLSFLNIGQGFVISIGLVSVMVMAGFGVKDGIMTLGDFVLVNSYLIQLFLPLNFLGFVYREIKQSLTDMEDMFKILEVQEEVTDIPNAEPLNFTNGTILFDNVSFYYGDQRQVLENISFEVKSGQTLAIVGASGAGKTTISRLIYRFYDVSGGCISIDGQDIRNIQQASLRSTIGIVPQDTVLFNDTIFYNISYGRPDSDPSEVERAAQLANIHEFVKSLPEGYNTMVGERGLKLSGGEKQRVAIARTILKSPKILVFDEATSALDTQTEKIIQQSLKKLSVSRTTIVIAHRLSTIIDSDEILVIGDGKVLERGTHNQLLAKKQTYYGMWQRQQELDAALKTLEHRKDITIRNSLLFSDKPTKQKDR
ncbi:MAG: ABC transporter ATP-binding protein/permease, partial [Pseudomonadota bacterium]|nr:ABC transporter ATP-binding protein/permease [Pseudomonadota bacterium]